MRSLDLLNILFCRPGDHTGRIPTFAFSVFKKYLNIEAANEAKKKQQPPTDAD
jgi:hypothetical protein